MNILALAVLMPTLVITAPDGILHEQLYDVRADGTAKSVVYKCVRTQRHRQVVHELRVGDNALVVYEGSCFNI